MLKLSNIVMDGYIKLSFDSYSRFVNSYMYRISHCSDYATWSKQHSVPLSPTHPLYSLGYRRLLKPNFTSQFTIYLDSPTDKELQFCYDQGLHFCTLGTIGQFQKLYSRGTSLNNLFHTFTSSLRSKDSRVTLVHHSMSSTPSHLNPTHHLDSLWFVAKDLGTFNVAVLSHGAHFESNHGQPIPDGWFVTSSVSNKEDGSLSTCINSINNIPITAARTGMVCLSPLLVPILPALAVWSSIVNPTSMLRTSVHAGRYTSKVFNSFPLPPDSPELLSVISNGDLEYFLKSL